MAKKLKAYMCGTSTTDLHFEKPSVELYSSIKALKKERKCWRECGILELDLSKAKLIFKGKMPGASK